MDIRMFNIKKRVKVEVIEDEKDKDELSR